MNCEICHGFISPVSFTYGITLWCENVNTRHCPVRCISILHHATSGQDQISSIVD
uniref:Uncharacterized protein n=1 Tax=Anguilla anguilla TaxID=7936 RepID=A0A0E9WB06_ANGAN